MATNYRRTLQSPAVSFFLFGMRGAGKTTWARERLGYGQVLCMTPSRSGLLHHAVDELHALDDLTQEFVTIELPPVALRASA